MENWRVARPLRAVVVGEGRLFGHGVTRLLSQRAGIDVVARARTGDEAVACVTSFRPDIVLIDISTASGSRATREVKCAVPSATVLAVMPGATPEALESPIAVGADGYLAKDAACSELLAVVVEIASLMTAATSPDLPTP